MFSTTFRDVYYRDYRINNDYSQCSKSLYSGSLKASSAGIKWDRAPSEAPLRDRCFFRRSVGYIVQCIRGPTAHFRSLWRLSHSCRARGTKVPSSFLLSSPQSSPQWDNVQMTIQMRSTIVRRFDICFQNMTATGRTSRINNYLFFPSGFSKDVSLFVLFVHYCVYQNPLNHRVNTSKRMQTDTK